MLNTPTIPQIPLKFCEFDKARKKLLLASELCGMPPELIIHSEHTGRSITFKCVKENDPLFDQDQWDGEQQIYRPVGIVKNIESLVIYHAY